MEDGNLAISIKSDNLIKKLSHIEMPANSKELVVSNDVIAVAQNEYEAEKEKSKTNLLNFFVKIIKVLSAGVLSIVVLFACTWFLACLAENEFLINKMEYAFGFLMQNVIIPMGTFVAGYLFKKSQ